MNSDKIKEIWKENAVKQIDSYTESEIKAMILKNARKIIRSSFPSPTFMAFLIVLTLSCIWIGLKYAPNMQPYWIVAAIILLIAIYASILSRYKMMKYSFDMNLKSWIEFRMKEFERSISHKKRYWFVMTYGIGIIFLVSFCAILIFTSGFTLTGVIIPFVAGLTSMIIATETGRRIVIKRMIKSRKRLQELYNQLEDSEVKN